MGMGDELMAAGAAARQFAQTGRRVAIVDSAGRPRKHELWRGNPAIATNLGPTIDAMLNGPGCRPYIDYGASTSDRWRFLPYRPAPAHLTALEPQRQYSGYVLIEPNIKGKASPNKQWGLSRWQAMVDNAPHVRWLQCGIPGSHWLNGVKRLETPDFITACSVLAGCRAAVLHEGGMHHGAAAVGVPAVVLFGAFISPATTGYDQHINIAIDDPEAAGWRIAHPACETAWNQIIPELVLGKLETILNDTRC